MPPRLILLHDIASRADAPRDGAAPDDFTLVRPRATERLDGPAAALAYCADLAAERVLFTLHRPADMDRLFAAPFLFPEQLRLAAGVATVPFERLDEFAPQAEPRPVFVFSPGRTGSTLLVRVLSAAGLPCASEPDMLTQVAGLDAEARRRLPGGMEALLVGSCLAALGRMLGAGAFVKLRSQCNARARALVGATPGCRAVFMLRHGPAWALSRHRAFQEPPEAVAAVLRQAIDALDSLAESGVALDVLWFESLAADPRAALSLCAPGARADPARLAAVMRTDAQAGTEVARHLTAARPIQDGFLDAFGRAWTQARRGAEWSAATDALLDRMWRD
jgi:hypothetical protein